MASERRETLSGLSVTGVFDRRLTLGELEELRRGWLSQPFNVILHTSVGEGEI